MKKMFCNSRVQSEWFYLDYINILLLVNAVGEFLYNAAETQNTIYNFSVCDFGI